MTFRTVLTSLLERREANRALARAAAALGDTRRQWAYRAAAEAFTAAADMLAEAIESAAADDREQQP